jgi:hypothetical protein
MQLATRAARSKQLAMVADAQARPQRTRGESPWALPPRRRSPDRSASVLYRSDVTDRSPVWDLSPKAPVGSPRRRGATTRDEEQTARKMQNLHYQFPTRSWRELEEALTEAGGHAGKARKRLRMLSSVGVVQRSTSPLPRAYRSPGASILPEFLEVQGLRHIGEKANGVYSLELDTAEASRLYLPSTIYKKTDGSDVSLFYDAGLWSIASSTSSEDALAFAEHSVADPCDIPPEAWSVSNGAVWVEAPLQFAISAVSSPRGRLPTSPAPLQRVDELYQDLGELEAGMVSRERLHSKISLMRQRLEDVEDALEDQRLEDQRLWGHSHIS